MIKHFFFRKEEDFIQSLFVKVAQKSLISNKCGPKNILLKNNWNSFIAISMQERQNYYMRKLIETEEFKFLMHQEKISGKCISQTKRSANTKTSYLRRGLQVYSFVTQTNVAKIHVMAPLYDCVDSLKAIGVFHYKKNRPLGLWVQYLSDPEIILMYSTMM